jgi:hypothetical protein
MPLRLQVSKRRYLCAAAAGAMATGLALAPPAGNAAPTQASAAHVVVQRAATCGLGKVLDTWDIDRSDGSAMEMTEYARKES